MCLPLLAEKSFLTLKLTLNFTPLAQISEGCQDAILQSVNIYTLSINNQQ